MNFLDALPLCTAKGLPARRYPAADLMSDANSDSTRTERFNAAVRTFELPPPRRQAKLMPFKEGIIELRQKGASLDLIRELLATIGVAVGKATIARFITDMSEPTTSPLQRQRFGTRPRPYQTADRPPAVGVSGPVRSANASPVQTARPSDEQTLARPRTRGPRIADPRNL